MQQTDLRFSRYETFHENAINTCLEKWIVPLRLKYHNIAWINSELCLKELFPSWFSIISLISTEFDGEMDDRTFRNCRDYGFANIERIFEPLRAHLSQSLVVRVLLVICVWGSRLGSRNCCKLATAAGTYVDAVSTMIHYVPPCSHAYHCKQSRIVDVFISTDLSSIEENSSLLRLINFIVDANTISTPLRYPFFTVPLVSTSNSDQTKKIFKQSWHSEAVNILAFHDNRNPLPAGCVILKCLILKPVSTGALEATISRNNACGPLNATLIRIEEIFHRAEGSSRTIVGLLPRAAHNCGRVKTPGPRNSEIRAS